MSKLNGEIIQWKKLYQLISGVFYEENQDTVQEKLLEVQKEIQDGILGFTKNTEKSSEKLEALMKEQKQQQLIPFTQKLYQFLDLDAVQSYDILCYYLVNEYRGSASSLANFVSSESLMIKLLSDIWFYYSLERMVLLKVTKNILEFSNSTEHPYSNAFKTVLDKIGMDKLRKSYIDQFELLVKDTMPVKTLPGDIFNSTQKLQSLSERKHREMNEILQIILLTCHYDAIKPDELKKLIELFKFHSFGKQNQSLSPSNEFHNELVRKITYSEIAVLLVALNTTSPPSLDWMNEIVEKLDDQIVQMHHYPEHGPILIIWMLFKYAASNKAAGQLGSRAVQLNVFDFLHKMVTHKMFRDKSIICRIVYKCIYDHLSFLCELFDTDGSMAQHPKIFELFSQLLTSPAIAKEFCKAEDSPIRSLFNSALEKFPFEFIPLSLIAKSLTSAHSVSNAYILDTIQNLPIYTEILNNPAFELRQSEDDEEYVLENDYQPFPKIMDFIIRKGTKVAVVETKSRSFVHFRTKLNYFNVLHYEINELMCNIQSYSEITEDRVQRLECGIQYLTATIKRIDNPNNITNEMIHPTEMVFDILNKLKVLQNPPIELMAACVNVSAELIRCYGNVIFPRVINLNITPSVNAIHKDYKSYANGMNYESGLVGYYLMNIERVSGQYSFLKAYMQFLKNHTKLALDTIYTVELPGLLFMLREIFVHAHSWRFENEQDKFDIFIFIFEYILDILQMPTELLKEDKARQLLRNICVYSLLNMDNGITLLRFVAVGNPTLQGFMENESNWIVASNSNLNLLVQYSMTILMQILRLKNTITDNADSLSPLEQLIYTQPKQRDTLKIIPIVTNYTTYAFNRRFPLLSCRLLRRFAIEFQRSLSACLDMEPDQIRMTFLQRLRDDLESNDLKIAVLEFVNACIEKQPGLTEAFFKVSYEDDNRVGYFIKRTKTTSSQCDGILSYMEEYLEAVSNDPSKTTNDQLKRIMSLFHSLWKNNMQSLVKDLLKKSNFWSSLCSPLLANPINDSNYQYSQLFNILGIEIFKLRDESPMQENFKKVLEQFMQKDTFGRWLKIVFNIPTLNLDESGSRDETPEWLSRLQSFKDFIVLLIKKKSLIEIPNSSKKLLTDQCMETLVNCSNNLRSCGDSRPFVVVSELYLILLNDYKTRYTGSGDEDVVLLKQVESLLSTTVTSYNELHKRGKESVLAIAIKVLDFQANEIKKHPEIASNYIELIVEMICIEISSLEAKCAVKTLNDENPKDFTIILCISLLKKMLLIHDYNETSSCVTNSWNYIFYSHKIFHRLLSVFSVLCPCYNKRQVTLELLELLVLFAKGSFSKELLYCEIGDYLWMKLLPPKELLERPFVQPNETPTQWKSQEWWVIYSKGIELVKLLLEQHSHLFINDALFFVGIHEEYLVDCILLAKQSMEPSAVKLIKITLDFIGELVRYEKVWRVDHSQSLMNIMKCVQILLDQSVSLLYRPKILKRLTEASSSTQLEDYMDHASTESSEDLIAVMNELIEIVMLCSKCLLQFSPNLLNLLCDMEFQQNKWIPFIEIQFGAPKMIADAYPQLSFGTVLSAIGLITKSLNLQHHTFKQTPLNNLPEDDCDGEAPSIPSLSESTHLKHLAPPSAANPPSLSSSPRRQFSKSLSMNSMTSSAIVPPSNELLSNLDTKVCVASLEFVLTLLASQSMLALKDQHLSSREKQMIRRELSTELHIFHDFVKKKILKDSTKSNLYRQKFGMWKIVNEPTADDSRNDYQSSSSSSRASSSRKSLDINSMRVAVIRGLHLRQKSSSDMGIPSSFSPIAHSQQQQQQQQSEEAIGQTPVRGNPKPTSSTSVKKVGFAMDHDNSGGKVLIQEIEHDEEPFTVNNEDPTFTGLSLVKMIEEDYLHYLSNVFLVICQNE